MIHRLGVELEFTAPTRLHPFPAPVLYAAVAAANGLGRGEPESFPDGVLVHPIEQCRVEIERGQRYRFGITLLEPHPDRARVLTDVLGRGIAAVGQRPAAGGSPLGGNFVLRELRDLVADEPVSPRAGPRPLPTSTLDAIVERCRGGGPLRLRFVTPLRMPRPTSERAAGRAHFDGSWFDSALFLNRLVRRLESLELVVAEPLLRSVERLRVIENHLVWLDVAYGPVQSRKTLGGAAGVVVLEKVPEALLAALALGQFVHVGQNTRFGFGGYRLLDAGDAPATCRRAQPLLDTAFASSELDRAAAAFDLPSGAAERLADAVRSGRHTARPYIRVPIPKASGGERVLSIPAREDRVIQRAVHALLAPALDWFFEDSSLAYRRGLGRTHAARMIQRATQQGFRFALKADFSRFFDSIDHVLLRARLDAYIGDDQLVAWLMASIVTGAPAADRGVPTGSPLSPLVANLFLDQFDEQIQAEGGLLVRYADDFLVLYRRRSDAEAAFERVRLAAEALALSLNEKKTSVIDLREPFTFLGFRFEYRDRWTAEALDRPHPIDQIGWKQAESPAPGVRRFVDLPGETDQMDPDEQSHLVAGPDVRSIDCSTNGLRIESGRPSVVVTVPLARIRDLLVFGHPSISASALRALVDHGISATIANNGGRDRVRLLTADSDPDPESVVAQVAAAQDESHRLALARRLIGAKVHNHGVLTAALARSGRLARDHSEALLQIADRCRQAASVETLLGLEGSAAARWYEAFGSLVPRWCGFRVRVAPDAEDPANILLNLCHSTIYRLVGTAIRSVGLVPGLGLLHRPSPGHDALASDLQEPFRHLADRAVLTALEHLKPGDFRPGDPTSDYRVDVSNTAIRRTLQTLHDSLALATRCRMGSEPSPYRSRIMASARSLRRHLLDHSRLFEVFEHP